ncbi:xanthine dehydrogenase family protein molybdopterin-binding subunit [Roseomonas sp. E05]|uniref:xanthine dehydrogenase family protein molybdopterin-binding subunit n=1 Tax=Roseomonas sp. E05 TaxID=3046310 RepID=UPI0024BB7F5A|nr:xanthine dehydrogenase family protein molybdopterin-binding subunit [Roseomonas sp. E05]MDJ0390221.1 xanthine dehydrogenase family protein molybdopterin-binding subunit [Roseomonas sp. E05]
MKTSGDPITRLDGPAKTTGAARYAGDQALPGQLHAVLVPSTIPAGRVTGIDARAALATPGVVRVLTASDMTRVHPDLDKITCPPLATRFLPMQGDQVLYEGQPVAIVLAERLEPAEAAAAAIRVCYQRDAFTPPETAPAEPPDPAKGDYSKSSAVTFQKGDAAAAIAAAPVRLAARYTQPSRHANPMEPSAILAAWEGDRLTVYDAVQHLPAVQGALAAVFGLGADKVRVVSPHTGGGFGAKAFIWPHEILTAMAARVVGRPVKLALSRQHMHAMVGPQPQMTHDLELGARPDGRLAGLTHATANITSVTDDYVEFGAIPSRAFYACDNITTDHRVRRGHVTLPTFMRSPWDGPGSWALGSAMDELARRLGVDPLDLRLANHADTDPESGQPWSSKKLREAYEEGARRFGWRERPRGGTRDGHWRIGCGMADCSQGQARFHSTARVRLAAEGAAVVESSFCDIGTGPATVFAQVAAEALGLDPRQVTVRSGDTDLPYSGPTYGSGTTLSTGAAVQRAAERVRGRLAALAGWAPEETTMREGRITRANESRTIQEVLGAAGLPELSSDGAFDLPGGAPVDMGEAGAPARTFGAIFVEVGVDPELGLLRLRRAVGAYSAGRILNPRTARSQMIGGIIWGWGMAAMEASHYEPKLGRWLSKDLAGVAIPVNADIPPEIEVAFVEEFDARSGPLGAKGIGELGATGVAAAVANAVYDAIGIRVRDLPITPDKLLAA